MRAAPVIRRDPHALQCMEIWGGNQAIDSAISVPGLDAWVYSRPHGGDDHGGDIHYVSTCAGGKIARFAVADVAGHGASVSDVASTLRSLMRKNINTLDQTRFIQDLNKEFSALPADGRFATAVLATYYAPTDHLVTCNAGHPPPLWYRARTGKWQRLEHDACEPAKGLANLPLGIIEPTPYYQFAVPLEKEDLILIYTDSLIEARNPQGQLLGEGGLLRLVRALDPKHITAFCHTLLEAVAAYRDGAPADDDVTLIVLHHNAGSAPRQSLGEMVRTIGKMLGLIKV